MMTDDEYYNLSNEDRNAIWCSYTFDTLSTRSNILIGSKELYDMVFKGIQVAYFNLDQSHTYAKQTVRKWKLMYFYDQHLGD